MEAGKIVENFLDRVRKKQAVVFAVNGLYLVLAVVVCGYLVGNFSLYYNAGSKEYLVAFCLALLFPLGYIVFRYLVKVISGLSKEQVAFLVEKHHPELKNSLINSWQLKKYLSDPDAGKFMSVSFIRELLKETSARIEGISVDSLVNQKELTRNRNLFLSALLLTGVTFLVLPDFFARGYNNLVNPPAPAQLLPAVVEETAQPPSPAQNYAVKNIRLKLNYPAYTRLPSKIINQPAVQAFPGTEVQVQATSNLPLDGAELIIHGKNRYAMVVKDGRQLTGTFLVKNQGFYQFGLKSNDGTKITLPEKHLISLKKDEYPKIVLFPSNPKPVYYESDNVQFFYEGHDDFGIGKLNLIVDVNGKTTPMLIQNAKGLENDVKGGYTWSLNEMLFRPGDEVQYYLEIYDNDNISGPKSGLSEIFAFTIFDFRKELENLINLQDELIDKMISLLAESLVGNEIIAAGALADRKELKDFLVSGTDQLIEIIRLAQRITDQAELVESFPEAYRTFFQNIISGLNAIRQEQINMLQNLGSSMPETAPVGYNFPPVKLVNEKLVGHLERDILFLVKISNRQKIGQVMDMGMQLSELTQSLRDEFERIKDKKAPLNDIKLKQKIQKIQQILKKMMKQLARQTRGLPDEFINSKAFESLDLNKFNKSLDEIMKKVKQGQIDNAISVLEELAKDLNTLARQMEQVASQMEDLVEPQLMEQIDKAIQHLLELEKEQKNILEDTTKIHQSLRAAQFKKFENTLKDFFAGLKKDVNDIQAILRGTTQFLDDNQDMKKFENLLDRENRLRLKIQELRQEVADATLKPELRDRFEELKEARNKLAELNAEKDFLRLKTYDDFKTYLPEFLGKYNALEELAQLFDLNEFNSLYKNTYPDTFRWQHNLRSIPKSNPVLSERLNADLRSVRKLNSEISKKLGSMMVDLREKYSALISEDNKTDLRKMSQKQNQTRRGTEDLGQEFSQMSDLNPMISSEFSMKMSNAGKYMKMAENDLRQANVPESIDSENNALRELSETREMLDAMKNLGSGQRKSGKQSLVKLGSGRARDPRRGGAMRMQREKIHLPSEDQYQVPVEFRAEILKAMKHRYPKKYERFVTEYYKELVK
ncbi:MAG: hypothetical protein ACE5G9_06410 [Nitrospinales bacterium]